MNTAEFSIKKNVFMWTLIILIAVCGISVYFFMGKLEDSGYTVHTSVITTIFPGASQNETALYVTDKIEKELQELEHIDEIISYSQNSVSHIYIKIDEKVNAKNLKDVWYNMRKKINDIKHTLPKEIKGPYINDE
ncbi:MAG: efflux RND transporter permease subunit, partial [Candidatus Muirbacterium halophilum]|nr:efflux RND transporter permease subunit [Candidatus Muirbacterium halophilum]